MSSFPVLSNLTELVHGKLIDRDNPKYEWVAYSSWLAANPDALLEFQRFANANAKLDIAENRVFRDGQYVLRDGNYVIAGRHSASMVGNRSIIQRHYVFVLWDEIEVKLNSCMAWLLFGEHIPRAGSFSSIMQLPDRDIVFDFDLHDRALEILHHLFYPGSSAIHAALDVDFYLDMLRALYYHRSITIYHHPEDLPPAISIALSLGLPRHVRANLSFLTRLVRGVAPVGLVRFAYGDGYEYGESIPVNWAEQAVKRSVSPVDYVEQLADEVFGKGKLDVAALLEFAQRYEERAETPLSVTDDTAVDIAPDGTPRVEDITALAHEDEPVSESEQSTYAEPLTFSGGIPPVFPFDEPPAPLAKSTIDELTHGKPPELVLNTPATPQLFDLSTPQFVNRLLDPPLYAADCETLAERFDWQQELARRGLRNLGTALGYLDRKFDLLGLYHEFQPFFFAETFIRLVEGIVDYDQTVLYITDSNGNVVYSPLGELLEQAAEDKLLTELVVSARFRLWFARWGIAKYLNWFKPHQIELLIEHMRPLRHDPVIDEWIRRVEVQCRNLRLQNTSK